MSGSVSLSGLMALNRLEEVKPEITVMDFGIDCTGCSSLIRNKLELVEHVV